MTRTGDDLRAVWKYEIPVDGQTHGHTIPEGATLVHVACQDGPGFVQVWALVDPLRQPETRDFQVYGTGQDVPSDARYVGTALAPFGLVWHVFEWSHE